MVWRAAFPARGCASPCGRGPGRRRAMLSAMSGPVWSIECAYRHSGSRIAVTYSARRRGELADFLRRCRDRIAPEGAGTGGAARRRAPGLRREEVAERAHVSTGYYIALEQGRNVRVSAEVLDSISRALGMNSAERRH